MTGDAVMLREDGGMTLTEFLLARIAEDEASDPRYGFPLNIELHEIGCMELAAVERSDATCDCAGPKRWLAECEAKRRIVGELRTYDDGFLWDSASAARAEDCLRALAAVYADHPDYRQEWAP